MVHSASAVPCLPRRGKTWLPWCTHHSESGTTSLRLSLLIPTSHPILLRSKLQKASYVPLKTQRPQFLLVDKTRAENIAENRHVLKCVAEAVLYCGRQYIALRGDNEKHDSPGNPGNFLSLMRLIANHDPKIKQHLDMPKLKNATYLSSEIQNEMIDVIGNRMIQSKIVQEVKDARHGR